MNGHPMISAVEMDAISARHPALVKGSNHSRIRSVVICVGLVVYMLCSWWFFSIGAVLGNANWGIAGTYLADWVSYEVRPDIRIAPDGTMQVAYPRFSPLGPNASPDWVNLETATVTRTVEAPAASAQTSETRKKNSSFSFMAQGAAVGSSAQNNAAAEPQTRTEDVVTRAEITYNSGTSIVVADRTARATHADETLLIRLDGPGDVTAEGPLPSWATQPHAGEKITLAFGFT